MADQRNGHPEWRPPWQAKSLWLAAGITLLGLVLWVATPGANPPPPTAEGGTPLAQASGEAVASSVHSAQGTPALFRFGLSYVAGFFLGYGIKRFLTLTLLVSAGLAGLAILLQQTGWLDLDWAAIEQQARASLGWLTGQAEALRSFLSGYVPSAAAAGVGIFMGMRWR
jgi:uncharacterized membrane protein (Fun14 family)